MVHTADGSELPPQIQSIHQNLLATQLHMDEVLSDDFPQADHAGAETFMRTIMESDRGLPHIKDALGAIALRNIYSDQPRYASPVCRAAAMLALSSPSVIQLPYSQTLAEFGLLNMETVPDPSINLEYQSSLITAYRIGVFPLTGD
jgi:hypothetical protein